MDRCLDLNLVVLCGHLSTDPELRVLDSGGRLIRYLILVRVDYPRKRTDVLPVILWEPPAELWDQPGIKHDRIWVCGTMQKRYWDDAESRPSGLEVVAEQVVVGDLDELEPVRTETQ